MVTYSDLKDFFHRQKIRMIIAADGETRIAEEKDGIVVEKYPAGGVSIALDPIARASSAIYIGRAKNPKEKEIAGARAIIKGVDGDYTLKRLFFSEEEVNSYYYGFANQTLWPLCHIAFQEPEFHKAWYEGFKKVNQKFAESIQEEIKGKTLVWINDYQLSFIPRFLTRGNNTILAMFWHIPWPTWEVFRILPYKRSILESILKCDFLAFHRGYQARNFINTVERELPVRIDLENNTIRYNGHKLVVKNLPMGIDVDVIKAIAKKKNVLKPSPNNSLGLKVVGKEKIILGVDRLDYTKGLKLRLKALDRFFEKYRNYKGKVKYVAILAPSREIIPAYKRLKEEIEEMADYINNRFGTGDWQPITLVYRIFLRNEIINFFKNADLCLVTPLDDGMNLVSKEFVVASSFSTNPGMLVLSQFAGSAMDLTSALIVNPYNIDEVVSAIKKGLEMDPSEKRKRIKSMAEVLDEKNIYDWAEEFVRGSLESKQ